MACNGGFVLTRDSNNFPGSQLKIQSTIVEENKLVSLYPAQNCAQIKQTAITDIDNNVFMAVGGAIAIHTMTGVFSGTSGPSDYADIFVTKTSVSAGIVGCGSLRVNISNGVVIGTTDNLTHPGNIIMSDPATGIYEVNIGYVTYSAGIVGTLDAITLITTYRVIGVNPVELVSCLIPECGIPSAIAPLSGNRIILSNYEFPLDPRIYGSKK